jgi:hypothetical protein
VSKSDLFDLLGICLVALFAFAIWPPLVVGVFGGAFLLAARAAS